MFRECKLQVLDAMQDIRRIHKRAAKHLYFRPDFKDMLSKELYDEIGKSLEHFGGDKGVYYGIPYTVVPKMNSPFLVV